MTVGKNRDEAVCHPAIINISVTSSQMFFSATLGLRLSSQGVKPDDVVRDDAMRCCGNGGQHNKLTQIKSGSQGKLISPLRNPSCCFSTFRMIKTKGLSGIGAKKKK